MGYKKDFFGNPSRIGRFSPYRPSCHSPSSLPQTGRPHPAPSPSSSRSHPRPHAIVGARASAWPDRPCPLGRARPLASPLPKPPATTLPLPPTSPPSINGGNCRSHDWPPASPSPTLPLPLPSIKPATTEFSPPLSSSPSPSPSLPFSLARPPPPPRPCPCPGGGGGAGGPAALCTGIPETTSREEHELNREKTEDLYAKLRPRNPRRAPNGFRF
jgi:hypothetical protein